MSFHDLNRAANRGTVLDMRKSDDTTVIIEQTETRSETFRTRFDLLIDDPPSDSRTTAPPVARRAMPVPGLDASASLGETEQNR